MMPEQKFIDKIEDLRHQTYSRIIELQQNLCPMVKKVYMNFQFEYWYDGYKYTVWEDDCHVYAVNEVPYCYDNDLKNTVFMDTLDKLVPQDKVWPFLLFINGEVVPWSDITVIHDYDYSYLKIKNIGADESFYTELVYFPIPSKKIRYGEDNDVLLKADRKGFYFGKNHKRLETTEFVDISVRFEILDENVYYKEVNIKNISDNRLIFEGLPDGYVPALQNILLFDTDGSLDRYGAESEVSDIYNGTYNMFKLLKDNDLAKWAILMYNTKHTKEAAHVYERSEDLSRKSIFEYIKDKDPNANSKVWQEVIGTIVGKFDFDFDINKSYEENIKNASASITQYDFNLWKKTFIEDCPIKSFSYKGRDFKRLSDNKGYVHMSRKHSDLIEDVVIMFVNNKLYDYSVDISYSNNTINIPIFGIFDSDDVELVMFTECNNNILDIKVDRYEDPIYIHPEYNLEDCYIMSEECPDAVYTVEESPENRKQYIVDLTYDYVGYSYYKIKFKKDYYYGKDLKIVPKKQFRYYRFVQKGSQFKIILPTQFNYCHDPDRYMVFVNGKKIDRTEYTITIMNEDRPFEKLIMYLSTILDNSDYVDIFYIPEILVEKYKEDTITTKGKLVLKERDNYPKLYPFSKYTTMVFVNGLKVNPLEIKDASMTTMLLNMDKYERDENGNIKKDEYGNPITKNSYVDSVNNVTVLEYVDGDKWISGFLYGLINQTSMEHYNPDDIDFTQSASDTWKGLINVLQNKDYAGTSGYEGLEKLFGKIYELENPAVDYKTYFTYLKSILYDVVIDYYLTRQEATTGDKFVYDYERPEWSPYSRYEENSESNDSTDITKLITLFPDHDKLLDYIPTDNIARDEDVKSGQKYYPADQQ